MLAPLPAVAAPSDAALTLPAPTGAHRVGASALHLRDGSRADPWVPSEPARELMVTVFYPTKADRGPKFRYQTAAESAAFIAGEEVEEYISPESLRKVDTFAYRDAPVDGRPGSRPLIVLSPGYTHQRNALTGLAVDLASHGYVVVAIDHTYENYAVEFPDGRVATCMTCPIDDDKAVFFPKLMKVHAADVSFVLDEVTHAWTGGRVIDASRIGMSGHSAGGAAALSAMLGDPRIDAGVDMDGSTWNQLPPAGLSRPFLFLGTQDAHMPGMDPSWDSDFSRLTGWRRWLTVAGTAHVSFTDYHAFADQVGLDGGVSTTGLRSLEITRRYNLAMFDEHLRHIPQPLLGAASACYPEVTIAAR